MIGERRQLIRRIIKTKKRWIGHVLRGIGLLKEVIEGRIDGKRPRGRKRLGMLSDLKEDGYAKMKRRTENRGLWRKVDAKMDLSKDRALEEEEID